MSHLDILAQHRNMLLLAEAIGWLHDYRKCSDEQLRVQAANKRSQDQGLPKNQLFQLFPDLSVPSLSISTATETLEALFTKRKGEWNVPSASLLLHYLSRCHNTAHFDKQEPVGGEQNYPDVQISSPFGFEHLIPDNLTNKLWGRVPWASLSLYSLPERQALLSSIRDLFSQVGADTRWPINEVDLWGWGLLVGALYKTALAGVLVSGGTPTAVRDLRWRLLSVRVDGLNYLLNAVRLPDLLTRQQLLWNSFDHVCCLLEETYPLGNEVYRDENGSLYVVADLPDLLNFTDSHGTTLQHLILQAFAEGTLKQNSSLQLGGERTPVVALEPQSWWGQDPDRAGNDKLPAIRAMLTPAIQAEPNSAAIASFWRDRVAEICTVCWLRPQGPGQKALDRNLCDICEQRRQDRSKEWATHQSYGTIWLDEVADTSGRIALLIGQFDLNAWQDGSLIDSLLVIAPQNIENKPITSKTPSFSRIWRIWKTTRQFWQEIQIELAQSLSDDRRRLRIFLDAVPDLGAFHAYDLEVKTTTLSVVWYPPQPDGRGGYLLSADNLSYIAHQLGAEADIHTNPATAAIWVEEYLQSQFVQENAPLCLRNPDAPGRERHRNLLADRHIVTITYQPDPYSTAIPILAEPRTFMTLVPADRSLNLLKEIKTKYEREMGKVRNRLPLHLGVIYFQRRTPLRAVLDAGQAMMQRTAQTTIWTVQGVQFTPLPLEHMRLAQGTQQFQQTTSITLERNGNTITWYVPSVMGDGVTPDNWYPYLFFYQDQDKKSVPTGRQRTFQGQRPTTKGLEPCWLVHAGDVQPGDQVYFAPSTFDFEFLDTAARRFDIYYNADGRRGTRRTRPFYLEDLDRLEQLWRLMKYLSITQRQQIVRTVETTRAMWYGQDADDTSWNDAVFRQFVADTLGGAKWVDTQSSRIPPQAWHDHFNALIDAGVCGELADLIELHVGILKERDMQKETV